MCGIPFDEEPNQMQIQCLFREQSHFFFTRTRSLKDELAIFSIDPTHKLVPVL